VIARDDMIENTAADVRVFKIPGEAVASRLS
jgi:hypothetical protein